MKGWKQITLLVIIIFIAVGSFYYLMFSSLFKGAPPISQNSYLQLNIYGEIPERSSTNPLQRLFAGETPSMDGLIQCIRKAKIDPKISGIILRPIASAAGWAKIEELRATLEDFKESGKPVYVYLEMAGNRDYYLALEGDMIFGPETGNLMITGFLAQSYFIKGTLDKLGITADFVRHGKYKDAPEIFTRKDMSDAQREVTNSILNDYYPRYIDAISSARKLTAQKVEDLVNRGLYTLRDGYNDGLIDTLMYYNEFKDYLDKKNNRRLRIVSYSRYKDVPFSKLGVRGKETIALIYGLGDIVSGFGNTAPEGVITSESMAHSLRVAADNKSVKAIVMRINSPGGSGTASDIIWREVVEARKKKPVIVSVSDMAASGGYYISMAADSIVAEPSSIVGSIGVFAGKFSFKGLYDKIGVDKVEIPRGKNADLFSDYDNFSKDQQRLMQNNIDEFYKVFVAKAAEGRHMTYEAVDQIARGRIWTGEQGLKNGLVDKLGGLMDAIQMAKEMSGIPLGQHVKVLIYPKQETFLERLLSSTLDAKARIVNQVLPGPIRKYALGFLYFRDFEALAMIPFYPEVQ